MGNSEPRAEIATINELSELENDGLENLAGFIAFKLQKVEMLGHNR